MTTDFDKMISLVNSIQADSKRQGDALEIASQAMENAHSKVNELVHFIRKMDDKPITQNERLILQHLYEVASILSNASIEMRFK